MPPTLKAIGINALHDLGIIHRDIKAENILIDIRENVRIADFGLSHLDADARPLDRQGAYSISVVGTPYCMAPEILSNISNPGSMTYGPPVDWWSLGCIVYQLVSPNHKARFASSFAAILLIQSFQPLFETQHDTLTYAAWCTSHGRSHKQYSAFQNFQAIFADLISGVSSYCSFSNTIIYLYRGSCWIPPRQRGTGSARFQAMNHSCFHVARRNSSMHTLMVSETGFV
jgi:serine/threonine protein kinase